MLDLVTDTGKVILDGLKELETRYPAMLNSARGLGTMCAVNAKTDELRDKLLVKFRQVKFISIILHAMHCIFFLMSF